MRQLMRRRDFVRLGAAAGAGALLSGRGFAESSPLETRAGIQQGTTRLPERPGFKTRHLVTIILGNGARKIDVIGPSGEAPCQLQMAREGTLFTEDYGETVNLHGYMYSEVLSGRVAKAQRPAYPTWNEYVRKKTGGKALEFWMLQGASYYGAWTWDVKNFSTHPEYGIAFGATNLTLNKVLCPRHGPSAAAIVDLNIQKGLGHSRWERRQIEAWIADVLASRRYELPSTRQPVIERPAQVGDCQALHLAGEILTAFKPRMITVQILGLDDGHAEFGYSGYQTGYDEYIKHVRTTDELIGNLWRLIQNDPYLRSSTSLIIRPECGRDGEVNPYGQLDHGPGDYHAHYVWTSALGPDFRRAHVVTERVDRCDLAPTITYLMSGQSAEYATGRIRTQLFGEPYAMPRYGSPHDCNAAPI